MMKFTFKVVYVKNRQTQSALVVEYATFLHTALDNMACRLEYDVYGVKTPRGTTPHNPPRGMSIEVVSVEQHNHECVRKPYAACYAISGYKLGIDARCACGSAKKNVVPTPAEVERYKIDAKSGKITDTQSGVRV